mmetsp:Transcript_106842/g.319423  ORF Transcript_106842/g.319423 Transcript_106842/m.319423 type:complete len:208 (+) Transcript_106842:219-842(+)
MAVTVSAVCHLRGVRRQPQTRSAVRVAARRTVLRRPHGGVVKPKDNSGTPAILRVQDRPHPDGFASASKDIPVLVELLQQSCASDLSCNVARLVGKFDPVPLFLTDNGVALPLDAQDLGRQVVYLPHVDRAMKHDLPNFVLRREGHQTTGILLSGNRHAGHCHPPVLGCPLAWELAFQVCSQGVLRRVSVSGPYPMSLHARHSQKCD